MKQVVYKKIEKPRVLIPQRAPELEEAHFQRRAERLRERMRRDSIDFFLIYADREHAANFSFFAGFDPRFEEALLVIPQRGKMMALLGNENLTMPQHADLGIESIYFGSFSLISQPRDGTKDLLRLLRECGLEGKRTALAGWKYYTQADGCPAVSFEVPHYIVEAARTTTASLTNGSDILMAPGEGLRTTLEAAEIARFEFSACVVATGIYNLLEGVEPGVSEVDLASHLNSLGQPLCCHPMCSFGDKARFGLSSPGFGTAELGDFMTCAFGVQGALTARAAYIAGGPEDLPAETRDWANTIAMPYFLASYRWLKSLRIGVTGGELYQTVDAGFPKTKYGWHLNPGHYIAADEWVSSPVFVGSAVPLGSGTYMQLDIIPSPPVPYFGGNMEDGYVLANEALRRELAEGFPDVYSRMQHRRRYMTETLGFELSEEVMPMSDLAGYYRPYLTNLQKGFIVE